MLIHDNSLEFCFGMMVGMIGVWNMSQAYRTLIGYPATMEGFRAIGAMIPIPIIFEITFRDAYVVPKPATPAAAAKKTQ